MSFFAQSPTHGRLQWSEEDGFTGNIFMLDIVNALIESGEAVPTVYMGPMVKPAASPEWVAWYTAKAAIDNNAVTASWSSSPPELFGLFSVHPGALA